MWGFRKSGGEPLAVQLAGVTMGNRLLAIGLRDPILVAALAAKVGLTGHAAGVDSDAERAGSAAAAIEREGALIEVSAAPGNVLPFADASFDVIVMIDVPTSADRGTVLREACRVLRPGGRIFAMSRGKGGRVAGLFRSAGGRAESPVAALTDAGFFAARVIAEREGTIYAEAVRQNV